MHGFRAILAVVLFVRKLRAFHSASVTGSTNWVIIRANFGWCCRSWSSEARRVREMEARETHLFTHDQDGFGIWMTMSMSPLHGTSVRDMDWEYAQRICPGLLGLDGRCRSTERSRRIWNRDGRCLLHGTSVRIQIWNTAASLKLFEVTAEGEESVLAFSVSMDDVSCTFVRRTSPRLRDPDGFGIRRPLRRRSCSR